MGVDFGTGYIAVEPQIDKTKAQGAMEKDLGASLSSAGKKMAATGGVLTAGLTVPLVALGTNAIQSASQLEDVSAAADVTFGKVAGRVKGFADDSLQNFGISETAALDAATGFAALGKSAGLQGGPLAKFSDGMVGLAGDLASFRGTSVEDALTAIGSGLRGEAEPLRKYGVLLDDATLRQEAVRQGLIKTTKDALTPQQKVLAAHSLILKQTGDAQGDFLRTGDSTANTMKVLSGSIQELVTSFGTMLLPVVQKVAGFVSGLVERFDTLSPSVKTAILVIAGIAAAAGPVLLVLGAIATAVAAITAPVLIVVAAIAALIAIGVLLWKNWEAIMRVLAPAVAFLKSLFIPVWEALKQVWTESILPALKDLWAAVKALWPVLKVLLIVALAPIVAAFIVLLKVLPIVIKVLGFLIRIVAAVVRAIAELVGWVADKLGGAFAAGLRIAQNFFGDLKRGWETVKDVAVGIWDSIWGAAKGIFNSIANAWNSTVGALSFHAPSWVPGIGGKGFDVPDIPTLAQGGIVTKPTLALLGERGREAVLPLSVLEGMKGRGGRQVIEGTLTLTPDSEVLIRGIASDEDDVQRRRVRTAARMNPQGRAVS